MRRASWLVGVWLGLALVACAPQSAPTGGSTPDDVNRVARQLYCPVCENEPLDACQTSACVQWKAQIAQYLADGKTDAEIVQIFVKQFGLRVKADPLAETPLLWIGAIAFAAGAGFYTARLIRRMSRRPATAVEVETPASTGDAYLDRVEQDLKQRL